MSLRILRLLCRGRHRIESYIREEHHRRASHYTAPTVVAIHAGIGWNERVPVCLIHIHEAEPDHQQHDRELEDDDEIIEPRRFLDADHEKSGHQGDEDDRWQIDDRAACR